MQPKACLGGGLHTSVPLTARSLLDRYVPPFLPGPKEVASSRFPPARPFWLWPARGLDLHRGVEQERLRVGAAEERDEELFVAAERAHVVDERLRLGQRVDRLVQQAPAAPKPRPRAFH